MRRRRRLPCWRATRLPAFAAALAVAATAALSAQPPSAPAQQPSSLSIAIPGDDGSLTPYTFESGYAFMSLIYDTLTWRDARGVAQPWLARSVRRVPTDRQVIVHLRRNLHWQDGLPLTAADVVFTYRFMMRRQHPRFTPELQDIDRVDAADALTVVFRMRRPALGFADQPLADVPILPAHLWADLPAGRRAPPGLPVGSGPYRMTRHERGDNYRLEANRAYFRGVPSIARIDIPVIRDQANIVGDLRRGAVDVVPLTVEPGTRPRRITGVTYSPEDSYSGTMLLFNVTRAPFRRLTARRAIARSLDLTALVSNASRVAGGAIPADRGMLHPDSRWALRAPVHEVDKHAARVAFAEQGLGSFRIAVARNDPVRLETAKRVVRTLRELGAGARLVQLAPRALDRALGRRNRRATFDAAVLGIPALASYDPSFLRAVFGPPRTAPLNDGGYDSAEFRRLAERGASATREPARRDAVAAELRFLARDLPAVPLLFGGGTFAYRPQAYDRWVSVRGTGILDKRSFLKGAASAPTPPGAGSPSEDLTDPDDGSSFSLVPVIIVLAVLALAGAVWWLRRRP
jgi:peptide/nickel transport system substrate-binding protein